MLIEWIQQVGANSRKLLSPSFIVICGIFAAVLFNLRYIYVTAKSWRQSRCCTQKPFWLFVERQNRPHAKWRSGRSEREQHSAESHFLDREFCPE